MKKDIPKISVLIICYKQEELIKRAIDSLLSQKDYIYEICISDDCSPDKTWNVLQTYAKQYPGLIKIHQNSVNIGIFENIEYTWSMPTGDIIYQLSGDDECGDGWFRTVIDYIQNNKIDYKNELFCIYGNYKSIDPNGHSYEFSNSRSISSSNLLSDALRWRICNRSCCFSIEILKKFVKCSYARSYIAEAVQDRQLQLFSEYNYYIPKVGNVYYNQIGVSTRLFSKERIIERSQRMQYLEKSFADMGYKMSAKDQLFCKYVEAKELLALDSSIGKKIKCLLLLLRSFKGTVMDLGVLIKQGINIICM